MKRISILLLVAVVTLVPIFAGNRSVLAADAENKCLKLWTQSGEIGQSAVESDSTDMQQQNNKASTSSLVTGVVNMFGVVECNPAGTLPSGQLLPDELKYGGLVPSSTTAMTNAFYIGPTANVAGMYANMFVPKQFLPNGGSAFAASTSSSAPTSVTATAYLQDLGVAKLWGISFTISMMFLVGVLIVAGLMIMFRSKAGGQTVVTVAMALQNVIFGSIMALASFALGGFFMNLSKYLVLALGAMFSSFLATTPAGGISYSNVFFGGPLTIFQTFGALITVGSIQNDLTAWWQKLGTGMFGTLFQIQNDPPLSLQNLDQLGHAFQFIFQGATDIGGYLMVYFVARLILGGAILIASIRIFWTVLTTYIKMLIDIILAPIIFMMSALPGKQQGLTSWIERMFKASISVPLMFAFVNVAAYMSISIAGSGLCGGATGSLLTCVSGGALPSGAHTTTDVILAAVGPGAIVATVLLFMVPTVPAYVEELFSGKAGKGFSGSWDGVKKSLQGAPVIGGLFQ